MNKVEELEKTVSKYDILINNYKNSIDELESLKKEAESEIAKLKKENQKQWIPKYIETYFYYDKDNEVVLCDNWADTNTDKMRLENKVIFETEKEAERYANYQKAKKDYTYEFTEEEWENEHIGKYYIYCKAMSRKINIDSNWFYRVQGCDYFKSEEKAQEFIDKYGSEILEYEFGIVGECYVRDR